MIRTKDINAKQKELNNLKNKAKSLEESINENLNEMEESDSSFEYAIWDAHVTADEKRLEAIQKEIEQAEYELKVMKGEIEPIRVRSIERKEVELINFGIEA